MTLLSNFSTLVVSQTVNYRSMFCSIVLFSYQLTWNLLKKKKKEEKIVSSCTLKPVHVRQLPEWARNWSANVSGEKKWNICLLKLHLSLEEIQNKNNLSFFLLFFRTRSSLFAARSIFFFFIRFLKANVGNIDATRTIECTNSVYCDDKECEATVIVRITFGISWTSILPWKMWVNAAV